MTPENYAHSVSIAAHTDGLLTIHSLSPRGTANALNSTTCHDEPLSSPKLSLESASLSSLLDSIAIPTHASTVFHKNVKIENSELDSPGPINFGQTNLQSIPVLTRSPEGTKSCKSWPNDQYQSPQSSSTAHSSCRTRNSKEQSPECPPPPPQATPRPPEDNSINTTTTTISEWTQHLWSAIAASDLPRRLPLLCSLRHGYQSTVPVHVDDLSSEIFQSYNHTTDAVLQRGIDGDISALEDLYQIDSGLYASLMAFAYREFLPSMDAFSQGLQGLNKMQTQLTMRPSPGQLLATACMKASPCSDPSPIQSQGPPTIYPEGPVTWDHSHSPIPTTPHASEYMSAFDASYPYHPPAGIISPSSSRPAPGGPSRVNAKTPSDKTLAKGYQVHYALRRGTVQHPQHINTYSNSIPYGAQHETPMPDGFYALSTDGHKEAMASMKALQFAEKLGIQQPSSDYVSMLPRLDNHHGVGYNVGSTPGSSSSLASGESPVSSTIGQKMVMNQHDRYFTEEVKAQLKEWVAEHLDFPYPTKREKAQLCALTALTQRQLENWFTNTRKRGWKQYAINRGILPSTAATQPRKERSSTGRPRGRPRKDGSTPLDTTKSTTSEGSLSQPSSPSGPLSSGAATFASFQRSDPSGYGELGALGASLFEEPPSLPHWGP